MKRKPPPKKRPIRIVKRPSAAARAGGQPARANNYVPSSNASKPANKDSNQAPVKSQPVPPYVAYDNNAYEDEVDLVTSAKKSQPKANGGLTGSADITGNVPNLQANGKANAHYENIDNANREKSRPRSTSKNNNGQSVPPKSEKPHFSRADKPVSSPTGAPNNLSVSRDSNYDTPKPKAPVKPVADSAQQRPRSETKSSVASSQKSDHTFIDLENDNVKFKPNKNNFYEDVETKT